MSSREEFDSALESLEADGYVERVGNGELRLTAAGVKRVASNPEIERALTQELSDLAEAKRDAETKILTLQFTLQAHQSKEWLMHMMNPDREQLVKEMMDRPKMLGGQGPEGRYTREQAEAQVDTMEKTMPLPQAKGIGRILGTADLIALNRDAIRRNYNRILAPELIDRLDPEGTHVVGPIVIPHEHAAGVKVAPHMRVQLLVKTRDAEEPVDVFLDMTIDNYAGLRLIAQNKTTGEWEDIDPEMAREALLTQIVEDSD